MNILKTIKPLAIKYKPELFISFGISGFIATSILNVRSTIKAVKLVEEEKEKLNRDLTNKEILKLCWKCYIPSIITTCASLPCIVIGNSINNKRNTALAAAYTVAETSLQTFKEEAAKTLSDEKFKELEQKVSQKKVDDSNNKECDKLVLIDDGNVLFYDEYSDRYFKSNWNTLQKIANELNSKAINGGDTITMSEWYDRIGLSSNLYSDNIGWDVYGGTRNLIDISLHSCVTPDNKPCCVLHHNNEPKVFFA